MAIKQIREHFKNLGPLEIFCTRDLLQYGKRTAVDTATFRLVKQKEIKRLASGVFIKYNDSGLRPSDEEIAMAKAKAFDRQIVEISRALALELGVPINENADAYFATNGRTTQFMIEKKRLVQFVGVAPRKVELGRTRVGTELRTFWKIGKRSLPSVRVRLLANNWSWRDANECAGRIRQLPQWLSEMLGLPRAALHGAA